GPGQILLGLLVDVTIPQRPLETAAYAASKRLQNSGKSGVIRTSTQMRRGAFCAYARAQLCAAVAWHRTPATGAPSRRSLSLATSSGPISSSSCAQTADSQLTMSVPSRAAVGYATAAIVAPTASGQTRCTDASRVIGASVC